MGPIPIPRQRGLFQRVQESIQGSINKGGKNSFCSRSTSVTLLGNRFPIDLSITYTPCNSQPTTIPYRELVVNGGYIPDCVIAGSPISVTSSGGDIFIPVSPDVKPIENTQTYQYFVQYGTTDCNTPPPTNLIFSPCNGGRNITTQSGRYPFSQGSIYLITFNGAGQGCYTFNGFTSNDIDDSILSVSDIVIKDCKSCATPTPTPTPFPTQTSFPPPTMPAFFSFSVGDTSYGLQQDACASSGGGTITVYTYSAEPIVNSTFLYTDSGFTTPYYSNGFVYYPNKGNYVLSTGLDGKLTSLDPCV